MCNLRGNCRSGAAQGAYSIFADEMVKDGPLGVGLSERVKQCLRLDAEGESDDGGEAETRLSGRKRKPLGELNANRERAPSVTATGADDETRLTKAKRRKLDLAVARRFGTTGLADSTARAPLDRFHVVLEAPIRRNPASTSRPNAKSSTTSRSRTNATDESEDNQAIEIAITFIGSDVFSGIRKLAEAGEVELDRMPAWMTGEEGVSGMHVRNGEVLDGKGGGA